MKTEEIETLKAWATVNAQNYDALRAEFGGALCRVRAAVAKYIEDLAESLDDYDAETLAEINDGDALAALLLNGAENWTEYSAGGCSLIYTGDIWRRFGVDPSDEDGKVSTLYALRRIDDAAQIEALNAARRSYSDDIDAQGEALAVAARTLAELI